MAAHDRAEILALPPDVVGSRLVAMPESQWFERKGPLVSAQKLSNALVAMANADGGTIVVGLGEGSVDGTDSDPVHRNVLMQAGVDLVLPPVRATTSLVDCVTTGGRPDHLLVFDVSPSSVVHATVRDEVYLRLGDHTRRLTFVERRELGYDKGQAGYEAEVVPDGGLDRLDDKLLVGYAARVAMQIPYACSRPEVCSARGGLRSAVTCSSPGRRRTCSPTRTSASPGSPVGTGGRGPANVSLTTSVSRVRYPTC